MIPREDFAREEDDTVINLFGDFPISHLGDSSPYLRLLRKPDFQRETNQWSPEQIATFIASFVDAEVIPSLILWRSPTYIFIIDGGHRLSALRGWINDDYGDGSISFAFYKGEIPEEQKKIAKRTRQLVEQRVARFTNLQSMAANPSAPDTLKRRANVLLTRALTLQWIQGNASAAETSFFKINSQGTPLDETEELLIRNRKAPIAIAARAVLRAGSGHKYWSAFPDLARSEIEALAAKFYKYVFQPESDTPLKTLDVSLGGSVSPIDALSLLIEFLTIAGTRSVDRKAISAYPPDEDGSATISILRDAMEVVERMTGNAPSSLGLHPAVYFYNERGKYSRFLFLGMTSLLVEKLRNNDSMFFKKFTAARSGVEAFLVENKSLITNILQNLSRTLRVVRMKELFEFIISEYNEGRAVKPEQAITQLGLRGRVFDVNVAQINPQISDDTKSMIFVREAIKQAMKCPLCQGLLDARKSVSYDHILARRDGGTGDPSNVQLVHPYCNSVKP
ncbi:MAG: DUF262 domain-containing protein [Candidatus Pacebacteria bacterium]|nr:DUF262 domain-containing protein [Candidatus Paceibacterota bacterium]